MVIDSEGNLFVADLRSNTIRKVVVTTGAVSTLAGSAGVSGSTDGIGSAARFRRPIAVAIDGAGNLFVSDQDNHTIRRIAIATRKVTTVVGSPERKGVILGFLPAGLSCPSGLAIGQSDHHRR